MKPTAGSLQAGLKFCAPYNDQEARSQVSGQFGCPIKGCVPAGGGAWVSPEGIVPQV